MKARIQQGIIMLVAALVISLPTKAQQETKGKSPEHRKEMAQKRFDEVSKKLELSAEQQTQLKALLQKHREQMKVTREQMKEKAKTEKREAAKAQLQKLDSDINAMLNDKQKTAYKKLKDERKAERKAKREQKMKDREEMDEIEGIF